ncbi:MAG: FGGY family carbohydrate kinase [Candidatus Bathyarchaeota archaeon]|nr:FGGY family carbohydrate kinase [Candidatus Bathyarchaeota archaeon]
MRSNDESYVMVFDCGSTNIRAVAVDSTGNIQAFSSLPNSSCQQPDGKPGWLIWDFEDIWRKICVVSREVLRVVEPRKIKAATIITWGADGAPVKRDGKLTYPPISWQCPRTRELADKITEYISAWEIFKITGYQIIPFNTLFKIIWLKKEAPEALEEAYTWLMMPGLIAHRMTGTFHIDPTIASTMMAMDLGKRTWSRKMLEIAGLDESFFPEWKEPGEVLGYVTEETGRECGLPSKTPVVVCGHDTQFAIFGSGAKPGELVLSSGTWEILSIRVDSFNPTKKGFEEGLIFEADVERGLWNPQFLMIASAVVEWVLQNFFRDIGERKYETIIGEIEKIPLGSGGLIFIPSFVRESGPLRKYGTLGTILGLTLHSTRSQIIRAVFEGLTFQMREALKNLVESLNIEVNCIRVVGGGSRNNLWNQMRADASRLPVIVPAQREAATLGAALISLVGIGQYASTDEAKKSFFAEEKIFYPNLVNGEVLNKIFEKYLRALEDLKSLYRAIG